MTTILERCKSLILSTCLLAYNGVLFLIINALLWCEGMWSERRWTKQVPMPHFNTSPKEQGQRCGAPLPFSS